MKKKKDDLMIVEEQTSFLLAPPRIFNEIVSEKGLSIRKQKEQAQFLSLGLLPKLAISQEMRERFLSKIEDVLEKLGIEPLSFDKIFVIRTELLPSDYALHPKHNWEYVNMQQWLWKYDYDNQTRDFLPVFSLERFGATNSCDNDWVPWRRRSVTDYVRDDNSLPRHVVNILEQLQTCGLPMTACPTIWSPLDLTCEENRAGHHYTVIDAKNSGKGSPILVLEFSDDVCIALCGWNPQL